MILVDTSAWIRAITGREPWKSHLDSLLAIDYVAGHPLIYGELLIGDTGGRAALLRDYSSMFFARPVPHEEVVALVRHHRLAGRGIGWIDGHLLASTVVGGMRLWTADLNLQEAARRLGVLYRPA